MTTEFLEWLSSALVWAIALWGALWVAAFLLLRAAASRIARRLRDRLHNLVATFVRRPDRDSERHIHDEIDVLLITVREVVADPTRAADRLRLARWVSDRDSDKPDFKGHAFERWYSLGRAQIEALPLAGITGTLLRMWAALGAAPAESGPSDEYMTRLTGHFANSLLSTMVALAGTIALIWLNAWFEPSFSRLTEQRAEFRALVAQVRRELGGTEDLVEAGAEVRP